MLDSLFPNFLSFPFLDFLHTLGTFKVQSDVYQSLAFCSSMSNYSIHSLVFERHHQGEFSCVFSFVYLHSDVLKNTFINYIKMYMFLKAIRANRWKNN